MCKVAVIIPIYNGEHYLRECLDSVCAQSLADIEIWCVDDGSTDSSCEILREFEQKDHRIKMLRQENQYCGIARNNGMDHSNSEYIIFWDCDDTFEPTALECMYAQAKKMDADICVCRVTRFVDGTNLKRIGGINLDRIPKTNVFNRINNENYILNFTNTGVWNKLFRREFISDIGLRFTAHRNAEDAWFVWIALCKAERITTVVEPLINYRVRSETSQVAKIGEKDPTTAFQVYSLTANYLKDHGLFPEKGFVNKVVEDIIYTLRNFKSVTAQRIAIEYLQQKCIEILCLKQRETNFYESTVFAEVVSHLLSDTAEEFQGFFNYETYIQLSEITMQYHEMKEKLRRIRSSRVYMLTNHITKMIRRLETFLKKCETVG